MGFVPTDEHWEEKGMLGPGQRSPLAHQPWGSGCGQEPCHTLGALGLRAS